MNARVVAGASAPWISGVMAARDRVLRLDPSSRKQLAEQVERYVLTTSP